MRVRWIASVAAGAVILASSPARAAYGPAAAEPAESSAAAATEPSAADDKLAKAKALFDEGAGMYAQGKYEEALQAFLAAQSFYASPEFLRNIAQTYERLDQPAQAISYYEAYLRAGDPEDRGNLERRIEQLREQLERGAAADQAAATPTTEPTPETAAAAAPATKPGRPLIITGAVLAGVGVAAGAGIGAWAGSEAADRSDQVDRLNAGNPDGLTLAQARDLDEEGQRFDTIQIVGYAVGGALLVTGAALIGVGAMKNAKAARGASAARRRGSTLARGVGLAPLLGRDAAGLTVGGRF
jgi:tetratricopeptide (TPR) repeat protein